MVSCLVLTLAVGALPAPAAVAVPADTLVDVGGRFLEVDVLPGTEPLTVVFEAGGMATMDDWIAVPESVAARTGATVVRYNRAGLGRSGLGPADLTPEEEIHDLVRALDALEVPERRIIVGASYGGMLAVVHAALYPDDVRGLVLADPMNSRFLAATGDYVRSTVRVPESPANDAERVIARMVETFDGLTRAADAERTLEIPIVVITSGMGWGGREDIVAEWRRSHAEIAGAGEGRELVIAEDSSHRIQERRPDVMIDAVSRVALRALR